MARKRAQIAWYMLDKDGKARCDDCGREFTHPSQYRLVADGIVCRSGKACAERQREMSEKARNNGE